MINVGPDGNGNIPEFSVKFLREAGKWLQKNGESIYATTYGLIPTQPWGVTTSKPGKQYLHVLNRPANGKLLVPGLHVTIKNIYSLSTNQKLTWKKSGSDVWIDLPPVDHHAINTVIVMEYTGKIPDYTLDVPVTVSSQFEVNPVDAVFAKTTGNTRIESLTYSHYFGDWKHATCVTGMKDSTDKATFNIRVINPGDYHIIVEYACPQASAKQEGSLTVNNQEFLFRTLRTSEYERSAPLMFIKHTIATMSFLKPGEYSIVIRPLQNGTELFKLKSIMIEPVK